MKTQRIQVILGITASVWAASISSQAQEFQNLNFSGPWSDGSVPGWTATWYNMYTDANLPIGFVNYIEPSTANNLDVNIVQDWGSSLFLEATPFGGPGYVSISQTGTVPVGTQKLELFADDPWHSAIDAPELQITFGGNVLQLTPQQNPLNGGVIEYDADISAYAGQTGNLVISAVDGPGQTMNGVHEDWAQIDDVIFSSVPEPGKFPFFMSIMAMLSLGFTVFRNGKSKALSVDGKDC